jgi:hypothetical protein
MSTLEGVLESVVWVIYVLSILVFCSIYISLVCMCFLPITLILWFPDLAANFDSSLYQIAYFGPFLGIFGIIIPVMCRKMLHE